MENTYEIALNARDEVAVSWSLGLGRLFAKSSLKKENSTKAYVAFFSIISLIVNGCAFLQCCVIQRFYLDDFTRAVSSQQSPI
ncbi:hypothetical protein CK203_043667 [Vitis vinifera]|uniref:Uncharacterized protein n=1 Tax=Vitis vinifera TaxID=29760 RepID=A0A438GYV7_VITVI|nr:hypothetical protein CK203_043667 [Vitis vinifera]